MDMQLLKDQTVSLKPKKNTRQGHNTIQSIKVKYCSQHNANIDNSPKNEPLLTGFLIW